MMVIDGIHSYYHDLHLSHPLCHHCYDQGQIPGIVLVTGHCGHCHQNIHQNSRHPSFHYGHHHDQSNNNVYHCQFSLLELDFLKAYSGPSVLLDPALVSDPLDHNL